MALFTTMTAWAAVGDEFTVNDLKYKVTGESPSTVELVGYETAPSGEVVIPAAVNGYSVTSIGDAAFGSCMNVTSVTIPACVESIGIKAFSTMHGLKSVTFAEGSKLKTISMYGFVSCSKLESIDLPVGLETIGLAAFSGCWGLASVTFPEGLTTIDDQAFKECRSLTSVNIPASVTSIDPEAFRECTALTAINVDAANEQYASIDGVVFSKDKKTICIYPAGNTATSYTIPDGVKTIGEQAFSFCTNLATVNIPASVTSIEKWAFWDCTGLESITIPSSVTSIGTAAFYYCSSLVSITIPATVETFGEGVFDYCTNVKHVYCHLAAPATETMKTNYGGIMTGYGYYKATLFHVAAADLETWTTAFPDANVTYIGDLDDVFLVDNLWYVISYRGGSASRQMAEGESTAMVTGYEVKPTGALEIPATVKHDGVEYSVTAIDYRAFEYCSDVTSITIPASISAIGSEAFWACTSVTDIYCHADPSVLVWNDGYCDDFAYDENSSYVKTKCHVYDKAAYEAKWATGNSEKDINVEFVGDLEEVDDINSVTADETADAWYTLNGVKLYGKPTAPGIYVCGGKKVVIR